MAGHAEGPVPPFPVRLGGRVMKGFGRGSKELGIPTANIPTDGLTVEGRDLLESGIYYGWAGLEGAHAGQVSAIDKAKEMGARVVGGLGTVAFGSTAEDEVDESARGHDHHGRAYPMVMSVGWNPFYKNTVRSVEIHIIHQFEHDFYDRNLNVVVLGFRRPEKDYESKEALIADIRADIEAAGKHLAQPENAKFAKDEFLFRHPKASVQDEAPVTTS